VEIAVVFDIEGEAGFRARESQVIDELSARDGVVLATGGGAVLDPLSRQRLAARGTEANKSGWGNRLLIINLEAFGDLISFTSVLKHYKKRFPNKKIFLLVKKGVGAEDIFLGGMVDEILTLKYRRFSVDPLYGAGFISSLRRIGFEKVINHDFSASEPHGKFIAVNLGAEKTIGYEGSELEFIMPFNSLQAHTVRYLADKVYPKYTDKACEKLVGNHPWV